MTLHTLAHGLPWSAGALPKLQPTTGNFPAAGVVGVVV